MNELTLQALETHLFDELAVSVEAPMYVAFSGGMDSTVLLHLMMRLQGEYGFSLRVLHVNHNISEHALSWSEHCASVCESLQLPFHQTTLSLSDISEQSARDARYQWFSQEIVANSILLTAHHQQDRAETVLFNLMRGSGIKGVASLKPVSPFHQSKLVRPLLNFSLNSLVNYAQTHDLNWVEDESNQELHYSRNHIRHKILPSLTEFRADAIQGIARAAQNFEQEEALLREVAISDLVEVRELPKHPIDQSYALCIEDIQYLSEARQTNLIRFWLSSLKLMSPSQQFMRSIIEAMNGHSTSTMILQEQGMQIRFYNTYMYVMPSQALQAYEATCLEWSNVTQPLSLYAHQWEITSTDKLRDLMSESKKSVSLHLIYRDKLEKPKSLQGHSINLKKWLNEMQVPPWRREQLPLLTMKRAGKEILLAPIDQLLHNDWVLLNAV